MSNRTKVIGRQRERVEVATMPGACLNTPSEIASMKQRTHDEIIRLTGRNRRGGVRWLIYSGRDECVRMLSEFADFGSDTDEVGAEGARQYLDLFEQYPETCALVVATVRSVVPAGVRVK